MRSIYVTGQFVALHRWKGAPDQVAFLRAYHRHVFKVRVDLRVSHNDRDLEFFMVKADLDELLRKWEGRSFDSSCEDFCASIFDELGPKYPTLFRAEVSEDGENGSVIVIENY